MGTDEWGIAGNSRGGLKNEHSNEFPNFSIREIDVIGINRKSVFSLAEAQTLFPIIFRLTKKYVELLNSLTDQYDEAGRLIEEWQSKVQKLGGLPNGRWVVDFDSGDGYFCWKYPEPAIAFWHHYRDGYSKRIQLSALTKFKRAVETAEVFDVIESVRDSR